MILSVGGQPFSAMATYQVALPRNLLKGAFDIQPLVEFAKAQPDALPSDDSFLPALNVIIMQQARHHHAVIMRQRVIICVITSHPDD